MMEESSECIGPKLAPFNPTGDDAIRVAIEMLEVTKVVTVLLLLRRTFAPVTRTGTRDPRQLAATIVVNTCPLHHEKICTRNRFSLTKNAQPLFFATMQLAEESILYDLGCGDGRLLTAAVKASGARGVCFKRQSRSHRWNLPTLETRLRGIKTAFHS